MDPRTKAAEARVARLATVDAEGHPHLVPCTFALDGDTIYSAVDDKPKTTMALKRLANVRANPQVSVLVDHYDDDWTSLWWVRLDGLARILEDGPERDRALALLAEKYSQYRDRPPTGPVLAVDVVQWRSWSASNSYH